MSKKQHSPAYPASYAGCDHPRFLALLTLLHEAWVSFLDRFRPKRTLLLFFNSGFVVVVVVPALYLITLLVHGVNFPWGWQTLGFFIVMSCLARWLDWPVSGDSSNMMLISFADQTRSVKNVPPFPRSRCRWGAFKTAIIRELKQSHFWAAHVNRKWGIFHLKYLDATKFVLLSFFTVMETACSKIWGKAPPMNEKSLLPGYARRSKTSLRSSLKVMLHGAIRNDDF